MTCPLVGVSSDEVLICGDRNNQFSLTASIYPHPMAVIPVRGTITRTDALLIPGAGIDQTAFCSLNYAPMPSIGRARHPQPVQSSHMARANFR